MAQTLKELRKQYEIKQGKFAEILGVPRSTLACWENGQRVPSRSAMRRIAQVFNLPYDEVDQMFIREGEEAWNRH